MAITSGNRHTERYTQSCILDGNNLQEFADCVHLFAGSEGIDMQISKKRNLVRDREQRPDSLYLIQCSQAPVPCSLRDNDGCKVFTIKNAQGSIPNNAAQEPTAITTGSCDTGGHLVKRMETTGKSPMHTGEKACPGYSPADISRQTRCSRFASATMDMQIDKDTTSPQHETVNLIQKKNKLCQMQNELRRLEASVLSMKSSIADFEKEIEDERGKKGVEQL